MENHPEPDQQQSHMYDSDADNRYQEWEGSDPFENPESYFAYNNDDEGDHLYLDEQVSQPDPLLFLSPAELNMYKLFISSTQAKIHVIRQFQRGLMYKLEAVDTLEDAVGGLQLPHLQCRMATLTTTMHQLQRYRLVLARNLLRVTALLGLPVTSQLWHDYYQLEDRVQQRRPNVHDMFLWQEDAQEINIENPVEAYVQPTLWRTAE